jgi:class 3 adenylate cyclase/tetratricopeptide (TPR) repeat protein
MQCPQCQFENREGAKFCKKCGNKFELLCPSCGHPYQADSIFCDECGCNFNPAPGTSNDISETARQPFSPSIDKPDNDVSPVAGERKHVTVLFSDLTGYTAMSEKLDPEEVKEITSRIFGKISKVVAKYDGFVEKYAGDAVMALFGATASHEDDPVRAIRAAREIHTLVDTLSPRYKEKIGQSLSMHTGINTGLVITGEVNVEKGTHGVAGDTINVASRLSSLASVGEILVGPDTYFQAGGHFDFYELAPVALKGRSEPVCVYKVLAVKDKPIKIHGIRGLRAQLVGRQVEMNQLTDAFQQLTNSKRGAVISIVGPAGTGKSRLIEEFRTTLNLEEIQWLEGHAYPYSQNIPYYPLINLLSQTLQIKEGDPPGKVKEKIETGISGLIGEKSDLIPYIGSLFSLQYPEIKDVTPEYWKTQLQTAVQQVLSALADNGPVILCLEDIHWADPSFLELIRLVLMNFRESVLFICVYRPTLSLFTSHQINALSTLYREIRLQDLSPSESQGMMESLLKTESIPSELQHLVQDRVEGNPFYIEELINSLIESETLVLGSSGWKIARSIRDSDISSTIHGVISGRLDRLEKETKRILQEASVIGRAFLYDILKQITGLKDNIDTCLSGLERLDLIKARTIQPELEYIFKHALTQEVVYNGLLKKERRIIHERIGHVIERLFINRLPEFYETLAFHFAKGKSIEKAVDYLMKSGDKSLKKYAVEESHQYYKEAYNLLLEKQDKAKEDEILIIDLLLKWAYVLYYRGDFKGLTDVLSAHADMAESLDDKAMVGMFYAWMGLMLWEREKYRDAYQYMHKSLEIGEQIDNKQVIGYACGLLAFTYAELGLLGDEAIGFGKRGEAIAKILESDHYLYFKTLYGMAHIYWFRGEIKKLYEVAKRLLDYGNEHHNPRSLSVGHMCLGISHFTAGDLSTALDYLQKAIEVRGSVLFSRSEMFSWRLLRHEWSIPGG